MRELDRALGSGDPWIGRILADRYRVLRPLAEGGMGRVYAAEQIALGRPVAIKVLDADRFADPERGARFEREALATSRLRSPHVVQVIDWGEVPDGGRFLVMELLPGCDLARLLMDGGLLGVQRTLGVLRQIAIAIDHAHAHGIVHRDLKPENVIVDQDAGDFVKILDFGIARDLRVPGHHTWPGEVVGTPEYMAPEQALGASDRIGPASDRFALAALALEMLTGDLPYPSAPPAALLRMIAESPPRRPSELGLDVPGLDAIFDRALARHPGARFESARAFVEALELALAPLAATEPDPANASGVRLRVGAALGAQPLAREGVASSDARRRARGADADRSATTSEGPWLGPPQLPPGDLRSTGRLSLRTMVPAVHPSGSAACVALPDGELDTLRTAAALVVAGLTLVGSAFAAGWIACLALAG